MKLGSISKYILVSLVLAPNGIHNKDLLICIKEAKIP